MLLMTMISSSYRAEGVRRRGAEAQILLNSELLENSFRVLMYVCIYVCMYICMYVYDVEYELSNSYVE